MQFLFTKRFHVKIIQSDVVRFGSRKVASPFSLSLSFFSFTSPDHIETNMTSKSYASATAAYAPLSEDQQPHPSLAFLDSAQPANREALRRHPHALDALDDGHGSHEEANQQGGTTRPKSGSGSRREEADKAEQRRHEDEPDRRGKKQSEKPGAHFTSVIKGHPAMEGRDAPEDIGGELAEPCAFERPAASIW